MGVNRIGKVCYSTRAARKGKCDRTFHKQMHEICDGKPQHRQVDCRSAAVTWYSLVAIHENGQKAYKNGQKWARDHCIKANGPHIAEDPGAHRVVFVYEGSSAKCLDMARRSLIVQIWRCHGKPNQTWSFNSGGQVWNDSFGPHSCLTAPNVPVWDDTMAPAERKKFMVALSGKNFMRATKCDLNRNKKNRNPRQIFEIKAGGLIYNPATNMCLNVAGGSKHNGSHVILWPCEKVANETWRVHRHRS